MSRWMSKASFRKPEKSAARGISAPAARRSQRLRKKHQSRRAKLDAFYGQVLAGRTVRDLYVVYAALFKDGPDIDSAVFGVTVEHAFYAGAASMLLLVHRIGKDTIDQEQAEEALRRLHEEINAYAKRSVP